MENGSYEIVGEEDGKNIYHLEPGVNDLTTEVSLSRMGIGLDPNSRIDQDDSELRKEALELAVLYPGGGDISYITDVLPTDQADEMSIIDTQATTLLDTTIPDFITGRTELNEANWESFQNELKGLGVDKITQYIEEAR